MLLYRSIHLGRWALRPWFARLFRSNFEDEQALTATALASHLTLTLESAGFVL
jgi:hypothetical protein